MGFSKKNPDNVGFSQIKWGFLNKSTLSADVGFFFRKTLLREMQIMCMQITVGLSEKPSVSAHASLYKDT